jgi:hypothetical protein
MAPSSLIGDIHAVTIDDVGSNSLFGHLAGMHPRQAEPELASAEAT